MDQFLKSLRHRHAAVQERIEEEQTRSRPDNLRLQALKRLRLRFREQIEFIERLNRSGQSVAIPVIRRRRLAPALARPLG
ncbi:YdcH family protein [Mycoplana ramosa]|uniref:YdcH family protein n=1 Tax=Mycoplana ramosa TaxID=40837 RepID=A0ABW3YZH7_MYCRA